MSCDETLQLLDAYLDDELDITTSMRVSAHLSGCSDCSQKLESRRVVQQAVKSRASYFPAPPALRAGVLQAIRAGSDPAEPSAQNPIFASRWNRRFAITGLAAALLLNLGAILLYWMPSAPSAQVAELVDSHVRSLEENHLMDVASTDQHTVKPWFNGKVEFSPPVIDLSAEGFPLVGGRLDYLNQRNVAALIYHRQKHVINLFVWPGETRPEMDSKNGFNLICFECKGMVCWAVSDLNPGELQQFVDLFKSQKPASTRF
jgi:anti-sigma factor (TIGR02949 family)